MRRHTRDEIRACKEGTRFTNPISQTQHDYIYAMIRLRRRRVYRLRDNQEVEDWFPGKLQRMLNENVIVPDGKGGYYFRPGGDKNELKKLGKALLIFFLVRSGIMSIDPMENNNEEVKATIRKLIQYYSVFTSHLIEAWKVVRNRPLPLSVVYPEGLEPANGTHIFPQQKFDQLKSELEEQGLHPLPEPKADDDDDDEESDDDDETDGEGEGMGEEDGVVAGGIAHMHTDNNADIFSDGHTDTDTLSVATMSPGGSCIFTEDTLISADMCVESLKDLDAWLDMYLPAEGGLKREREHGDGYEDDCCEKRVKHSASDIGIHIKPELPLSVTPSSFDMKCKLAETHDLISVPSTIATTASYTSFTPKYIYVCGDWRYINSACIDTAPYTHTPAAICHLLIKKEEVAMGFKQEEDVKGCMGGFCEEPPDVKVCADELLCDEMLWDEEEEEFHPLVVEALTILCPEKMGKRAWLYPNASTNCASWWSSSFLKPRASDDDNAVVTQ